MNSKLANIELVSATGLENFCQEMGWEPRYSHQNLAAFLHECLGHTAYKESGYDSIQSILKGDVRMLAEMTVSSRATGPFLTALKHSGEICALTIFYPTSLASDSLRIPMLFHSMRAGLIEKKDSTESSGLKGKTLLTAWEQEFGPLQFNPGSGYSKEDLAIAFEQKELISQNTILATASLGPFVDDLHRNYFIQELVQNRGTNILYADWLMTHPRRRIHGAGRYCLFKMLSDMQTNGASHWLGRTVLPANESLFKKIYAGEANARAFAMWTDPVQRIAFLGELNTEQLSAELDRAWTKLKIV